MEERAKPIIQGRSELAAQPLLKGPKRPNNSTEPGAAPNLQLQPQELQLQTDTECPYPAVVAAAKTPQSSGIRLGFPSSERRHHFGLWV